MATLDINAHILDLDGSDIPYIAKEGATEEPYTFYHLIRQMVNVQDPRDDQFDKALLMGMALASQKDKFAISAEQVKMLADKAGRYFSPLVLWRTCEWLGVEMPSKTKANVEPNAS